jgi:hypothetical protein
MEACRSLGQVFSDYLKFRKTPAFLKITSVEPHFILLLKSKRMGGENEARWLIR